jgi:hypothetical protein
MLPRCSLPLSFHLPLKNAELVLEINVDSDLFLRMSLSLHSYVLHVRRL